MHTIFSDVKNEYIHRHLSGFRPQEKINVIDLGCGPGTNAHLFLDTQRYSYLGIDNNPGYIKQAQKKFPIGFRCANIVNSLNFNNVYDVVLINSVIHHIDASETKKVLQAASQLLTQQGECMVLDMVHPDANTFSSFMQRLLIKLDRGKYCRSIEQLGNEISVFFKIKKTYTFSIKLGKLLLWDLRLLICCQK
ncbi:class I SAM-dependent methyltransferase [Thermodesulfobacteriota bacterium]